MIHLSASLSHYKRPEIQEALVEHAANKEVAARFGDNFGKRPEVLQYPSDVLEMAKKGATSFHCSEELWRNPLHLKPLMGRKELDEMRIGWDLVLDVDCKFLEYSKIAADLILKALKHHKIRSLTAKFSGNHGFHIAVPFESFPKEINGAETRLLFPEAAKRIALYIKENITARLASEILELEGGKYNDVAKKTAVPVAQLASVDENNKATLKVEPFLAIDTILLSSRHMYRMPYSMHEKSGLVSIPVAFDEIMEFDKKSASPEAVTVSEIKFLERSKAKPSEEVKEFFTKAFDATFSEPEPEKEGKEYEVPAEAVPEKFFPPCMQKLLKGVDDGRKRALFILINFLSSCGWSHEAMESRLTEWNKQNRQPLHPTYFLGQLRYHKQQRKKILPPNCDNKAYYTDLRVKCPEEYCRFKNPANYARKRANK